MASGPCVYKYWENLILLFKYFLFENTQLLYSIRSKQYVKVKPFQISFHDLSIFVQTTNLNNKDDAVFSGNVFRDISQQKLSISNTLLFKMELFLKGKVESMDYNESINILLIINQWNNFIPRCLTCERPHSDEGTWPHWWLSPSRLWPRAQRKTSACKMENLGLNLTRVGV